MLGSLRLAKRGLVVPLVLIVVVGLAVFSPRLASGNEPSDKTIARGGGTTIIHGGTGASGGFVPVLTTIAFHAERTGGSITGSFECLALAPEAVTGSKSAQFTVNAMYVTGPITGASVQGDTATLTGTASITGLGLGSNVPFTFVVHNGGPGATATLTVNSLTSPFNETLVEGSFQVQADD
jgi:hypothetical protein